MNDQQDQDKQAEGQDRNQDDNGPTMGDGTMSPSTDNARTPPSRLGIPAEEQEENRPAPPTMGPRTRYVEHEQVEGADSSTRVESNDPEQVEGEPKKVAEDADGAEELSQPLPGRRADVVVGSVPVDRMPSPDPERVITVLTGADAADELAKPPSARRQDHIATQIPAESGRTTSAADENDANRSDSEEANVRRDPATGQRLVPLEPAEGFERSTQVEINPGDEGETDRPEGETQGERDETAARQEGETQGERDDRAASDDPYA